MLTTQRQNTFLQINYGLLLLTAGTFFFSRYIFLPIALLWLLVVIVEWNWKDRYNTLKENKMLLIAALFLLFYLLYIFGPLHSENINAAISDWEYKIWFLAAPICIMPLLPKLSRKQLDLVLLVFTLAIVLVTISCFIMSCILFINPPEKIVNCPHKAFFYMLATALPIGTMGHPSYCSLYETCAWLIAAEFLRKKNPWLKNRHLKRLLIACLCLFSIHTLLLQSKVGVFFFLIVIAIYFVLTFCTNRKRLVITCVLFSIVCFLGIMFIAKSNSRLAKGVRNLSTLTERVENNPQESNAIRVALWGNSIELLEGHWLTGIGNGDIYDALHEKAVEHNYIYIASGKFNTHSQILQCYLGFGILGGLLIIALMIVPAVICIKNKSLTSTLIILAFILNVLVESMLEQYSGATLIPIFTAIFTYRAMLKPCNEDESALHNPSNPPLTSCE